jgi:hypothetical protein
VEELAAQLLGRLAVAGILWGLVIGTQSKEEGNWMDGIAGAGKDIEVAAKNRLAEGMLVASAFDRLGGFWREER